VKATPRSILALTKANPLSTACVSQCFVLFQKAPLESIISGSPSRHSTSHSFLQLIGQNGSRPLAQRNALILGLS